MKKTINNIKHAVIGLACLVLVFGIIAGDMAAATYYTLISSTLGQTTFRTEETSDTATEAHFTSDYDYSMRDIRKAQQDFAKNVQEEGSVILKMGALPVEKSGNVTLLGAASGSGFLYAGSGSGAISNAAMPTLMDVFTEAGYNVNPTMWEYYTTGAGRSTQSANGQTVGEAVPPAENSAETASIAQYNDIGIVVIARAGAEATDIPFTTAEDPNKHFLQLSDNELALVDYATAHFSKVVVMLNTMQPVELSPILDKDIAIIWIGAAGEAGAYAIPEILNGTRNPSGRLVDTYATHLMDAPSVANQGNFNIDNIDARASGAYYVYAEGIYIGYRYYETRYADQVMGTGNVGDWRYEDAVDFPFGYGQSYSTFDYSDYSVSENGDNIDVAVKVTNTSSVPGKEVVQVYMSAPYTDFDKQNGIEKSAVELVGFQKTDVIAAGGSETVTVSVPKEYMRTYDAAVNRTYILEAGDYYFAVGKDAHDANNNVLAAQGYASDGNDSLAKAINVAETDTVTYSVGENDTVITNQFDNDTITNYDPDFKYLSRSDWTGTFPVTYGGDRADETYKGQITANAQMLADDAVPDPVISDEDEMPTTGADNGLVLADMFGLEYDHELWDQLLDELTVDEMKGLLSASFGNAAVNSVQKPHFVDSDGPQGITSSAGGTATGFGYPIELLLASTWNLDLAQEMGSLIGEDSLVTMVPGWYAPAANIHRSAFSGRNFEYYSEDPTLSGKFAGSVIHEAAKKGVYAFLKHFALNDQETNRNSASTFANEQSIRQIYLRPFELAIREYGANTLMLSMNRIGMTWSGHHVGLLRNVTRGEWGFVGMINTDASGRFDTDINDSAVYAGTDCFLNVQDVNDADVANATMVKALRNAAHNILYVTGNSNGMNGISSSTKIINVTPHWVYGVVALNVVVIGAAVAGFVVNLIYTIRKNKKALKEAQK